MPVTECGHGHIYDSDIYPTCPYCNSAQPVISFGNPGAARGPSVLSSGKTAPLNSLDPFSGGGQSVMEDTGVTMPPREVEEKIQKRAVDEQRTMGPLEEKMGLEPVAGWLVCVEGKEKGRDYKVLARINTIGRSENMDICIKGDLGISKEDHARVGYDPKNNRFRLIPESRTNNIYLNDDVVDIPTALHAYDVIDFGETKLVFIPLCSPRFNWEDGVVKPDGGDGGK